VQNSKVLTSTVQTLDVQNSKVLTSTVQTLDVQNSKVMTLTTCVSESLGSEAEQRTLFVETCGLRDHSCRPPQDSGPAEGPNR